MNRWIIVIAMLAAVCGPAAGGPLRGGKPNVSGDETCNLLPGYDLYGADLGSLQNVATPEECCEQCKNRPACYTFLWGSDSDNNANAYCLFKKRDGWKLQKFDIWPVVAGCVRDCDLNGGWPWNLTRGAAFNDPRRWANMGGFDQKRFLWMGSNNTWSVLFKNQRLGFKLANQWYAPPTAADPDECVLQRSFKLINGTTTAQVSLVTGPKGPWRMKLWLNGRPITGNWTTAKRPPVFVSVRQAQGGVAGQAVFDTGFARITMTQPWFKARNEPAGWMDVLIDVRKLSSGRPAVLPPVSGILGPSYVAALNVVRVGGGAAATTAAGFALTASSGKV